MNVIRSHIFHRNCSSIICMFRHYSLTYHHPCPVTSAIASHHDALGTISLITNWITYTLLSLLAVLLAVPVTNWAMSAEATVSVHYTLHLDPYDSRGVTAYAHGAPWSIMITKYESQ